MPIKDGFPLAVRQAPGCKRKGKQLPNVSVDIAIGVLTVVTGVVGSGKTHSSTTRFYANTLML